MASLLKRRRPSQEPVIEVIERGPNWLFLRVATERLSGDSGGEELAGRLWRIAETHLTYRLVLEMHGVRSIDRRAEQALRSLRERLRNHGGALRLCSLQTKAAQRLEESSHGELRSHDSTYDAAMSDSASWHGGAGPIRRVPK